MNLRVVGAGLPRTGTSSLRAALQQLLGAPCYHMSAIPGHPFDLGGDWHQAFSGEPPDWNKVLGGCAAAVDWPASMFWRELTAANVDALVLLSVRDSSKIWWESMDATVLRAARMALAPHWSDGRDLVTLLERFAKTDQWDDRSRLMTAYEQHNAEVRESVPSGRLLEWRASEGWDPICRALGVPAPDRLFPWTNRRSDWG